MTKPIYSPLRMPRSKFEKFIDNTPTIHFFLLFLCGFVFGVLASTFLLFDPYFNKIEGYMANGYILNKHGTLVPCSENAQRP